MGQNPVLDGMLVFGYAMLMGTAAAFVYDFYAGIGYLLRLGRLGLAVGDFIYWLVVIPLISVLMLIYNQGEMRFFVLLGLLMGAGAYFLLFRLRIRHLIIRLLQLLVRIIKWLLMVLTWLIMALLFPFKLAYHLLAYPWRLFKLLLSKLVAGGMFVIKRVTPGPVKKSYRRLQRAWPRMRGHFKKPPPPAV